MPAGRLEVPAGCALSDEQPLFAADASFAREHGGPITAAFVRALPTDWGAEAIVDSSLVWLVPGLAHALDPPAAERAAGLRSPPRFFHEPFPGATSGMRGEANRRLAVRRRLCVLGVDCGPEVAEGEWSFSDEAEAAAFWLPSGGFEARDRTIEEAAARGEVTRWALRPEVIYEATWGSLLRARPATTSGFQLLLRATVGDGRPVVNGVRNLVAL